MKYFAIIALLFMVTCSGPKTKIPNDGLVPPAPQMTYVDELIGQSSEKIIRKLGRPSRIRHLVIVDSELVGPLSVLIEKEKIWKGHSDQILEYMWENSEWQTIAWFTDSPICFCSLRYRFKDVEF